MKLVPLTGRVLRFTFSLFPNSFVSFFFVSPFPNHFLKSRSFFSLFLYSSLRDFFQIYVVELCQQNIGYRIWKRLIGTCYGFLCECIVILSFSLSCHHSLYQRTFLSLVEWPLLPWRRPGASSGRYCHFVVLLTSYLKEKNAFTKLLVHSVMSVLFCVQSFFKCPLACDESLYFCFSRLQK